MIFRTQYFGLEKFFLAWFGKYHFIWFRRRKNKSWRVEYYFLCFVSKTGSKEVEQISIWNFFLNQICQNQLFLSLNKRYNFSTWFLLDSNTFSLPHDKINPLHKMTDNYGYKFFHQENSCLLKSKCFVTVAYELQTPDSLRKDLLKHEQRR